MKDKAEVKLNPLMIFVISLTLCFFIGEVISREIYMPLLINLVGVFTLFMFIFIFIISIRMFFIHKEKLPPSTPTIKIIKTGIYSYSRNPIYVSFIGFQISMFLIFENVKLKNFVRADLFSHLQFCPLLFLNLFEVLNLY